MKRHQSETIVQKQLVTWLKEFKINKIQEQKWCKFGKVDIITPKLIIEVKHYKNYKEGIGQLLTYNKSILYRKSVLYIFSYDPFVKIPKNDFDRIFKACRYNDIYLIVHNFNGRDKLANLLSKYKLENVVLD